MTKFIAIISGKGGVGKTTTILNLGSALMKRGKKVILLDANFMTPNLSLHLGVPSPKSHLNDFLKKKKSLNEVIHIHHSGLNFIPSSISYQDFKKTNPENLSEGFEHLENLADFVLVDSPAGLGHELIHILKNTDETIVIVNPNLSSLVDALKAIELAQENNNIISGIVLNMTNKGKHELHKKDVEETLGHPIVANVQLDKKIRKALYQQVPSYYLSPRSRSSKEYDKLAKHLLHE